ncbi:MAG: hypothetical protein IH621_07785 [Krumholzibacteria bacterium]|nr:hypothetical protein [Candidatus Krumholzibacteria bacterium]
MNRARPRRTTARRMLLLVACALVLAALPAEGDLVRDQDAVPIPDARAIYELVRRAFEDGDQQIMADLVHADGLRVRRGGGDLRETTYSPSQAFYYFKNLFQVERTVTFTFLRMEEADGGRVHAMATWVHRRPGDAADREVQLVFVLSRQGPTWRLAEITTIG